MAKSISIAELIGVTPEMMRACGNVIAAEFELARWEEANDAVKHTGFFAEGIIECRMALAISFDTVATLMRIESVKGGDN